MDKAVRLEGREEAPGKGKGVETRVNLPRPVRWHSR